MESAATKTAKIINVLDAKTNFSRILAEVEAGQTVVVCRRNEPLAELRPLKKAVKSRKLGWYAGEWTVDERFFESLPDDMVAAFSAK